MATVAPARSERHDRAAAPEDRAVHLFSFLLGVSRLSLFVRAASLALLGLAVFVAALLAAVFVDAVLALSPTSRLLVDVLLGAGVLAAAGALLWIAARRRDSLLRSAHEAESRLNVRNSLLMNAIDFASVPSAGGSPVLRDRVVRLAEECSREWSALEVVPFRRVWRALAIAAGAILFALCCWAVAPRVFAAVLPRYVDPRGDHPPYTLATFEVRITPEPVYQGRPATITAKLGGPVTIERADVVFLADGPSFSEAERRPMFRSQTDVFALELEQAGPSRRFFIDTPEGRSPAQTLESVAVPFFEDVTVRLEYPTYTGWEPQEQALDSRGLRALVGTEVILSARSNLPLDRGELELALSNGDGAPAEQRRVLLGPLPTDARVAQGRFTIRTGGTFSLSLTARGGGRSLAPLSGVLTAVPDHPPRVAIMQPQQHIIVVEDWTVPVAIEAVDDIGVSQLRLNRSVNGWGPSSIDLELMPKRTGAVGAETAFDLKALGARAGDVITYYATAADNHPDPRQFADSPTHVIEVISEEDYVQFARQQYQLEELSAEFEAIQQALEELARQREAALQDLEKLQENLASDPESPQLNREIEQADEQLQKLAQASESLSKRLAERADQQPLYDLEQPYTEALDQLANQLQEQSQAAQAAREALEQLRKQGAAPEQQRRLGEALDKLREQTNGLDEESQQNRDAMQQDLAQIQAADELLAQAERLKSVIQQQRDVTNRLGEFQNRSSLSPEEQERADELARQQEVLEQELQEIANALETGAQLAREHLPRMSESAQKLASAIREQKIPDDQQQAASQARQGDGRSAHERAQSAARKLESLAGQCPSCRGAAGELSSSLDGPLSLSLDSLEQSLNQLSQGRSPPGLPRGGQGRGQGRPGGSGQSGAAGAGSDQQSGEGADARWRPGQTFPGSPTPTPVLGPRTLLEAEPRPSGSMGGAEHGVFPSAENGGPIPGVETLTPQGRDVDSHAGGALRGVPVPYRRDAEAYFRRLAEDEAAR